MKPLSGLEIGRPYFTIFYADDRRQQPIVETYVYIGEDRREEDGASTTEYIFQFARSFYQHGNWNRMTQDERAQYGDSAPIVTFDASRMESVFDRDGLVAELGR